MDASDSKMLRPRDRDSHDLSVQLTRYSVVDSMLLSLAGIPGELSAALPSTLHPNPSSADFQPDEDDDDPYVVRDKPTPAPPASAHTHSASHSGLIKPAPHIDDTASKYSAYHATGRANATPTSSRRPTLSDRGRQVNSFPPAVPADSDDTDVDMFRSRSSKGHAKKPSNGSNADIMGQPPPPPRFHVPIRAASFDHVPRDGGLRPTPKRAPRPPPIQSPDEIEAEYAADAAPTPTIPGGPRRHQDVLASVQGTPVKLGPSRQNSVKSSRTLRKGKSQGQFQTNNSQEPNIRDQARQFVNATNNLRNAQSNTNIASVTPSAAPSPAVGHRKSIPSPAMQPPQKQGFFRRVFGGGSKYQREDEVQNQQQAIAAVPSSAPDRPRTQPAQQRTSGQFKSASRPPTQDPHSRGENMPHQTLRKSSSSFFRRRKRSVDQNVDVIPPVPSLQFLYQPQEPLQNPAITKINTLPGLRGSADYSLQSVMTPYLTGPSYSSHAAGMTAGANAASRGVAGPLDGSVPLHASSNLNNSTKTSFGNGNGNGNGNARQSSYPSSGRLTLADRQNSYASGPDVHGSDSTFHNNLNADPSTPNSPYLNDAQFTDSVSDVNFTARMPTRPAPIPGALDNLQPHVSNGAMAAMSLSAASMDDRPLLSPISDHSFMSAKTQRSLSSGNLPTPSQASADEEFIFAQNGAQKTRSSQPPKSPRVWLRPSESEERLAEKSREALLQKNAKKSDSTLGASGEQASSSKDGFQSANSLPMLQFDEGSDAGTLGNITEMERKIAQQIFDGDETFISKVSAAAWLGQTDEKNARTRQAYMELYDWAGTSLLAAFRELCNLLILRAESQQLDRVIDDFSARWCECNPNHGFKGKDVVHTLAFAILMLNTDLHVTDSDQRMTRSQFVKNTLPTLRSLAVDSSFDASETVKVGRKQERGNIPWDNSGTPTTSHFAQFSTSERPSLDVGTNRNRLSRLPLSRSDQDGSSDSGAGDTCTLLVNATCDGNMKNWESQVETILKEFYNSIRTEMLPLHGNTNYNDDSRSNQPAGTLSVVSNAIRRTPSVLSKAPSDSVSFRGRPAELRAAAGRFTSKSRNRPRMYPSSTFTFGSSRTSLDDQSVWSPAASTFTKHSFGKTQTSMSVESLGSWNGRGAPASTSFGFANAVSRKITREENGAERLTSSGDSIDLEGRAIPFLENEDLELHGPPWAKEGILHHLSWIGANGKRAKDRRPVQCFAVVAKGHMRLFSFTSMGGSSGKSALRHLRQHKLKSSGSNGAVGNVVGGGNWAENAEELGSFMLRQTWASCDTKSKSKEKPTWYMHLPTGEIHAFIVNSIELADEWTWTVNYWSARLSRQPLIGGVSSEEYGWSENLLNVAGRPGSSATTATSPPGTVSSRPPSSMSRVSLDQGVGNASRARLPGDRTMLHEWRPPAYSMMSSQLMEVDQKTALEDYLLSLDEEFSRHSELRPMMTNAVSEYTSYVNIAHEKITDFY